MTITFIGATRINRSKMHQIVIEMFNSVDINNEVFREEAGNQEPVMVWPSKSNRKNKIQGNAYKILKMGKSFMVLSRACFFF
jgi:hypothetical protein